MSDKRVRNLPVNHVLTWHLINEPTQIHSFATVFPSVAKPCKGTSSTCNHKLRLRCLLLLHFTVDDSVPVQIARIIRSLAHNSSQPANYFIILITFYTCIYFASKINVNHRSTLLAAECWLKTIKLYRKPSASEFCRLFKSVRKLVTTVTVRRRHRWASNSIND